MIYLTFVFSPVDKMREKWRAGTGWGRSVRYGCRPWADPGIPRRRLAHSLLVPAPLPVCNKNLVLVKQEVQMITMNQETC